MTRDPWRRVPTALDEDPDVRPGAIHLWRVLDDLARTARTVEIAGPTLCRKLGCSPRALRLWRSQLVAAGYLEHESSTGGRNTPSWWTPLRRGRKGTPQGVVIIGANGQRPTETRHSRAACEHGNAACSCRVSSGPYKDRAGEEEEALPGGASSAHQDPPCGRCAPDTRLLEVTDDVVVMNPHTGRRYPDGQLVPCPYCSPITAPAF